MHNALNIAILHYTFKLTKIVENTGNNIQNITNQPKECRKMAYFSKLNRLRNLIVYYTVYIISFQIYFYFCQH